MKKLLFCSVVFLMLSCKNNEANTPEEAAAQAPVALGKELFEGKGNCVSCHLTDKKAIGPSVAEISRIYRSQNGNIVDFLQNDAAPIVDPSQYEIMKTNFAITKSMTDAELKAIEAYMYSF